MEKEFRRLLSMKNRLAAEADALDPEDRHFERMKSDLDDRIYSMYDQISEIEEELAIARNKKTMAISDKMKADNIYKVLIFFEDLYNKMNEDEKRQLISILISEIHVHEERTANGQWLNEIVFALPIISTEKVSLSLNNGNTDETVVLLKNIKTGRKAY